MVAEVDIRGWRTIWQCLHNVFFSTFASSLMTMRSYMQFITVILLQQIFWMQGKKKWLVRSLSVLVNLVFYWTQFFFLNSRICFRWWGFYVWWIWVWLWLWLWLLRVNHCIGALWREFKNSYYCSILEHTCACICEKDVFFRFLEHSWKYQDFSSCLKICSGNGINIKKGDHLTMKNICFVPSNGRNSV